MGHIDTAEMYGSGEVERIVGEAIAGRREEVALAFLIRHQNVFAIPKTASRARAVENARAAEVTLSEEEIAKIEQAFPKGKPPRRLPTI